MSKIVFIALAAIVLMTGQETLVASGESLKEPLFACLLALLISPWIDRQFK
jgi:hypothetical protein